jgi:hypothetical protein
MSANAIKAILGLLDKAAAEQKRQTADLATLRAAMRDLTVATARSREIRLLEERLFLFSQSAADVACLAHDASAMFRGVATARDGAGKTAMPEGTEH